MLNERGRENEEVKGRREWWDLECEEGKMRDRRELKKWRRERGR